MFSDGSHFRRAIRYVGNVFGEVFHDGLSGALSMLSLVVVDGVELFCAVDSFCLEGIFLPREWSKDPPHAATFRVAGSLSVRESDSAGKERLHADN